MVDPDLTTVITRGDGTGRRRIDPLADRLLRSGQRHDHPSRLSDFAHDLLVVLALVRS